jgi:hypothetical protein
VIRGLVLMLGVAACAQGAEIDPQLEGPFVLHAGGPEPEPAPCGLAFDPDPELLEATEAAAARWSAATGCDVRIEAGGIAVRIASTEQRGGHQAAARRNRETGEWAIGVAPGLLPWTADTLLTHEFGHVLGCVEHTPDGLMAEVIELYAPIDESALRCVCAVLECAVFALD